MNDRSFVILSLGVALVLSAGCSGTFERLPTIGRANSLGVVSSTKATSVHVSSNAVFAHLYVGD